ncbi:hypothetical protein GF339_19350 [candidate division KSB3 bacterium]|uniref:Nif11 domain-containing protein n=1 Tax=candidate division KSB3 bacterium TaxID=2044937 RepID=A0A9D5JYV0_9BACT|nr:hypothetical protein [candidate division KSB3 bacterium]MBD3326749.1 hypothetical protein [candidate division KSB3 bacterium]
MSVADFKKFGQLCAESPEIRERVKEIGLDNIDGWIEFSKNELGLEFDKDDIQKLAEETSSDDELDEDQLEQIAGGAVVEVILNPVISAVATSVRSAISGW